MSGLCKPLQIKYFCKANIFWVGLFVAMIIKIIINYKSKNRPFKLLFVVKCVIIILAFIRLFKFKAKTQTPLNIFAAAFLTQSTLVAYLIWMLIHGLFGVCVYVCFTGMGGHYVLDEHGDRDVNFSIIYTSTITGKVRLLFIQQPARSM